ncbi:helix-turn-helix transcriptional regulator [Acidithiobacillus thiooxidans]|uniref:helix-turn-helix domain-containing protein n=1 Tax=Acidithiobacillus thiooxidans TaxID=930 RepID=UPI00242A5D4C|nr:helix-turn-helix transcriptional regulator [Acidithiobacillus thiooxidans]
MNMNISGETVRSLRLGRGWTQEHLAALSGRNVRTIQRVEKSSICDLETRAALASVFQIDAAQLDGSKKVEQPKTAEGTDALYYPRLTNGSDIVSIFDGSHMYRFTNEDPRSEPDAEYMAWITSQIHDYSEIWGDIEPGSKVKAIYEFGTMLREMEEQGIWIFGLRTKRTMKLPARNGGGKPAVSILKCNTAV